MTKRKQLVRLGHCYELAGKAMLHDQGYVGAVLVHGSLQGNGNPRIDHAWLEYPDYKEGPWVWETATDQDMPLQAFYDLFAAQLHRRYTLQEVREKVLTTGHWGPWEQEENHGS